MDNVQTVETSVDVNESRADTVPAVTAIKLNGEEIAADLANVKTISEARHRLATATGEPPAHIRLIAAEREIMDSEGDFDPSVFRDRVVTVAISKSIRAGFYYLDDCTAFNGDSDVDDGEDEIEICEDGTTKREVLHRRSWLDGGGNSGSDVRHSKAEGTWELDDENTLHMNWTLHAAHKGSQPSQFSLTSDGGLMYRKWCYRYASGSKMKVTAA
eukprot:gnl/TRDRNA2_/TRDRNA2_141841_c0_seq1.p1 gnl/TRDRNA2_/TRDRNA2_141841_c0~~gnl/TRDRNA2_/TRDRNA2_141841_c0_seq1.p1  ORF type:complete len:215 (+),score=34.80 gnl/TRDRNA2_/TRDRNA2_141841_c0_seq1:87-731(+)